MKKFNHNLVNYSEIDEGYNDFGRFYITPNGKKYPSVTTVLGKQPKPQLEEWRKRVGEEKADRLTKASANVGSEFHDACERFIRNEDVESLTRGAQSLFAATRKVLIDHVDNVRGIEIPMWSDYLKVAGRSDLIAEYDGVLSIIDYKNSRNEKTRDFCKDYFLQAACYSRMFYERYGIAINQCVIIVAEWGKPKAKVFVEPIAPHYTKLKPIMKKYNPLFES